MIEKVLIICIGNICRSPVAEALLALKCSDKFNVKVSSAGLEALVDNPADKMSYELMLARGIDISSHRARQVTAELVFDAELILTMTTDQTQQLVREYPSARGRTHRIGKWEGYDVPDPYRRAQVVFEQSIALIDQGIEEWYRKLWN